MRFLDAILCISLAWKIHATDEAVRRTAKRCLASMDDKNDRKLINSIINSKRPVLHVEVMLRELPDYILKMGWSDKPTSPLGARLPVSSVDPSPSISMLSPLAIGVRR